MQGDRSEARERIARIVAERIYGMVESYDAPTENGTRALCRGCADAILSAGLVPDEASPVETISGRAYGLDVIDRLSKRKLTCRELARYIWDRAKNTPLAFEQDIARLIANERRQAVERSEASIRADEREKCAKVAEQFGEPYAVNTNTGAMMFRANVAKIAAESSLAEAMRVIVSLRDWLILAGDLTCREVPLGIARDFLNAKEKTNAQSK